MLLGLQRSVLFTLLKLLCTMSRKDAKWFNEINLQKTFI